MATALDISELVRRDLLRDADGDGDVGAGWDDDSFYRWLNAGIRDLRSRVPECMFVSSVPTDLDFTDISALTDTVPVADDYLNPLAWYVAYSLLSQDSDAVQNLNQAGFYRRRYEEAVA
jgi:hypothetical protein